MEKNRLVLNANTNAAYLFIDWNESLFLRPFNAFLVKNAVFMISNEKLAQSLQPFIDSFT